MNNKRHEIAGLYTANFGRRFFAAFIDLIMLTILIFILKISFPDFSNMWFFKKASPFVTGNATNWVLSRSSLIVLWIIYSIIMDCTSMRGTLGKQLMHVVVSDENGNCITLPRSLARNSFKVVSYAIAGLGFLWMLVDKKSRRWHDIVANTLVLNKP